MDRVQIQVIADEAGASNAVLIEKAKELGYDVKAANSTITVDEAGILIDYAINGIKPKIISKSNNKIMNTSDKFAIEYIDREYEKIINTIKYLYQAPQQNKNIENKKVFATEYINLQSYLVYYEDIDNENLREIFAYFHENINRYVEKLLNESENSYWTDSDSEIKSFFSKIKTLKYNLKNSKYAFKMKDSYEKYIIETNNIDYSDLEILEVEPIFELLEGLELFQELITKLYDKNWDIGKIFQTKIEYKSFKDKLLVWESMLSSDEKTLLTNNWKDIKGFVYEIFGSNVKIENISVKKLNTEKNKNLNQVNTIVKKKKKVNIEVSGKEKFSNDDTIGKLNFDYKNILLKGVPGTGKSRTLENIINNHLNLKEHYDTNVLRINIHSASSNADLMQGIAINSNSDGDIEYKEKQGLILELIERATFNPNQPFVLVLEEIQENSLNELIGDLIYLVEDSKRADKYVADNKEYAYSELVSEIMKQNTKIDSVKLPSLISKQEKIKRMIIPHNLFIFCTSNYREDRKVIEDNLLRRFDVIEIYPKLREEIGKDEDGDFIFRNEDTSDFLEELNKSIVSKCKDNGEIHPDRFMIGHSIWLKVEDKKAFSRAFLKVITEFKDVKDMHFDDFKKITDKLDFPFELEKEYKSYEEWIKVLQKECYSFLSDN